MMHLPNNPTLLYVTNPMCAWCYGFTPVVRRLRALWHGRLNVHVLLGDLQAYETEPLEHVQKERLALSWHRVQERTLLPFDYRFFIQRKRFVYNTEPPCRALLCVRLLRPVLTLEVLRALHSAFFAEKADITSTEVLVRLVRKFGISENLFLALFESEEIMQQLKDEFDYGRQLEANNFPSVYLQTDHGAQRLTKGFCGLDELEQRLMHVLEEV